MKIGKAILIAQAVLTLIIGILFLIQLFSLYSQDLSKNIGQVEISKSTTHTYSTNEFRFRTASYILVTVSLIELVIIWRLMV
jgi:hypothetical protein